MLNARIEFTESGKALLPGRDDWMTVDEADQWLHGLLRELHGLPNHPSEDPPPHPRHGYGARVFTPGLRGDAA